MPSAPHSENPGAPEPEETVSVQVDEGYATAVDSLDLARAVMAVLAAEGRADAQVTVVVTGDAEVQALNRQFLDEDHPTDVLSFPAQESRARPDGVPAFVTAPDAAAYLGDIVIACPFAQRQAERLGRGLRDELRLLAVHGALHLLGYDHAEPAEEAAMWARQDAILGQLPK